MAVVELGQFLAIGVGHRGAEVHRQVAGDVGLGLELFEVVFVGLGVDVPVEVLEVVAGDVLAVFGELDAEALERAGVQAGQKALDDEAGPRRSSRATWRITSGRRYFSGVAMRSIIGPGTTSHEPEGQARMPLTRSATSARLGCQPAFAELLVLAHVAVADDGQKLLDHVLAGLALGLGLEVGADAVAQHRDGHLLDVVDGHAESAVHRRHRLAGVAEVLAGAARPRYRPSCARSPGAVGSFGRVARTRRAM